MKRIFSALMLTIFAVSILVFSYNVEKAKAGTITVPDDYATIQEAINNANLGDSIYVRNGTYEECVTIDKDSLSLIGDRQGAFINGTVTISANDVTIRGFRITPIRLYTDFMVFPIIELNYANGTRILDNSISGYTAIVYWGDFPVPDVYPGCGIGIFISNGKNNIIKNNRIDMCITCIETFETENLAIIANDIQPSDYGSPAFWLYRVNDSAICHNNIYGWCLMHDCYSFTWDKGYPSGGNYWSDYTGLDLYSGPYQNQTGSDGIGDTPYFIDSNNTDLYPLMAPWIPLQGDINDDRAVDILDIVAIASIYGCKEGEPNWTPQADLAPQYGKIDILDLVTCAAHYGEKYP